MGDGDKQPVEKLADQVVKDDVAKNGGSGRPGKEPTHASLLGGLRTAKYGIPAAVVGAGLLAVAVVAALGGFASNSAKRGASLTTPPTSSGTNSSAAAPASTRAGTVEIYWGDTAKIVSTHPVGNGCDQTWLFVVRIARAAQFVGGKWRYTSGARLAGQSAQVMLYGPDFPGRPRLTRTVGADGAFDVRFDSHKCFTNGRQGVALLRVGSNRNVLPPPSAVTG